MDPDRSWGAVVFDDQGKYLLVHHASGNHWDHPKGHSEKNETPLDTALREIREEGGITAEIVGGFRTEAQWTMPNGRGKKVVYYLARKTGETAGEGSDGPEGEILGKIWLDYPEARKRITYETGKRVLEEAHNFIGGL